MSDHNTSQEVPDHSIAEQVPEHSEKTPDRSVSEKVPDHSKSEKQALSIHSIPSSPPETPSTNLEKHMVDDDSSTCPPELQTEQDELALVLAMSASEAAKSEQNWLDKEDEELARALAESLLPEPPRTGYFFATTENAEAGPSNFASAMRMPEPEPFPAPLPSIPSLVAGSSADETLATMNKDGRSTPTLPPAANQMAQDEALARQPVNGEEVHAGGLPTEPSTLR